MNNNNKFKVLLINPSGWQKGSINLGLCYLAASLQKAGFPTRILDLNQNAMNDYSLLQWIKNYSPFIVGISLKTATANEGGRLANILSEGLKDVVYVVGGPHITIASESYMSDFPAFHYALMGESEHSIVALASAVANGTPVDAIEGLVHRRNGQAIINGWCPPENLDTLPLPSLDSIEGFKWDGFRYPIVTSRGCPFQCTYCCVNKLTGSRKWRYRSAQNVVDELEYVVRNKGIELFEILDDNFTLDLNRAKSICRELLKRKLKLSWYCHNGIRADRIDKELALLMKQAGCTSVAFGIESGNPETFDAIKKGEPLSAVVKAVRLVKSVGIKAVGYFIIGLPGDTLDKFIETVRFQRSLNLDHYVFGMLIPYPKTDVWDIVRDHGVMFSKITETQHFSDDIVPISFELPEFPRNDMIRAFYIARFFDLYELTQKCLSRGHTAIVVYTATPNINKYLSGMLIACQPTTQHIVICQDKDSIIHHPSFKQVMEGTNLVFSPSLPSDVFKNEVIVVTNMTTINKEILFNNSTLLMIDPDTYTTTIAKKRIETQFYSFNTVVSILGIICAMPNIIRQYGLNGLLRKALTAKIVLRFLGKCEFALSFLWYILKFSVTKKKLISKQVIRKGNFPYDNHPSYM